MSQSRPKGTSQALDPLNTDPADVHWSLCDLHFGIKTIIDIEENIIATEAE